MSDKICKIIHCNKNKINNLSKKVKEIEMNCCNGGVTNLPDGSCFSDYLFWDGNKWKNGDFDDKKRVHIGCNAGKNNQGSSTIAIGENAGNQDQKSNAISIGFCTGFRKQGEDSIAIGEKAGNSSQKANAIAIGNSNSSNMQATNAIAIGNNAGFQNQGEDSIAIGEKAGILNQHSNTIILNATGTSLDSIAPNSFYVNPIRGTGSTVNLCPLYYNTGTHEILYFIGGKF